MVEDRPAFEPQPVRDRELHEVRSVLPPSFHADEKIAEDARAVDAIRLLDVIPAAKDRADDEQARAEFLEAVEDLRLRAAATRIGVPVLSTAVGGVVEAFTSLAVGGAFG